MAYRSTVNTNVLVIPDFSPDASLGFIYTHGLATLNLPELIMVDVPAEKESYYAGLIIGQLATISQARGEIPDGFTTSFDNHWLVALDVDNEEERLAFHRVMTYCDASARIMLIKPLFDEWQPLQDTPEGKVILKRRILNKWKFQNETDGFLLWKDGNRENFSRKNVREVSVYKAFVLRSDCTNWDACLTDEEYEFAEKHWDYFVCLALAHFAQNPVQVFHKYITLVSKRIGKRNEYYKVGKKLTSEMYTWPRVTVPWAANVESYDCAYCGMEEGERGDHKRCNKCKIVSYCTRKCQKLHWKIHKKVCCKS